MPSYIKTLLYAVSVFVVFTLLALALKYFSNRIPENAEYFGLLTNNDLLMGALVAAIVTITHIKRRKLQ